MRGEETRGVIRSLPCKDWGTAVRQRGQQGKGPEVARAAPSEEQQGTGQTSVEGEGRRGWSSEPLGYILRASLGHGRDTFQLAFLKISL